MKEYLPGDPLIKSDYLGEERTVIAAGTPLQDQDLKLLRAEYEARLAAQTTGQSLIRSIAFVGMFAALFSLFAGYLYYQDRVLLDDLKHFSTLLGLIVVTLVSAWVLTIEVEWRTEIIPITLFAMTVAIAYNVQLSIVLSGIVGLAFAVAHRKQCRTRT